MEITEQYRNNNVRAMACSNERFVDGASTSNTCLTYTSVVDIEYKNNNIERRKKTLKRYGRNYFLGLYTCYLNALSAASKGIIVDKMSHTSRMIRDVFLDIIHKDIKLNIIYNGPVVS